MKPKTLTEKRFFEWHEDDVSVTLRNRGGSYGGGQRYSLSALPGNHRSIVCHRLQMGAAGTSDARETDSMRKAIGLDFQNCLQTGDKAMTLTGGRIDGHSVPCTLIVKENHETDRNNSRPFYSEGNT